MADRSEAESAGKEFALQPGPDLVPAPALVPDIALGGVLASLPTDPSVGLGEHGVGGDPGEEAEGRDKVLSGRKSFANRLFSGSHFTDSIRSG